MLLLLLMQVFSAAATVVSSNATQDSLALQTDTMAEKNGVMINIVDPSFIDNPNPDIEKDTFIIGGNPKTKRNVTAKDFFKPDPKKATWYAIVCPGLGQIYNRSYWKLPVLYGGMLTFTYLISWNGRMYNEYHNAYHDILDNDPATESYLSLYPEYNGTQTWLQNTLKTRTNNYRRSRDLSTFGMVALYLVSVIDAFVDAHLYDFTVSDDLSMHWEPVINANGLGNSLEARQQSVVGFQCCLKFK